MMIKNSAYGILFNIGIDRFINMDETDFYQWMVEFEAHIHERGIMYKSEDFQEYFDFLWELLEVCKEEIERLLTRGSKIITQEGFIIGVERIYRRKKNFHL